MKVPGPLKAQLERRLKALANPNGYVVHYLIVQPTKTAEARVVLGGVAKSSTIAALKVAYPQDAELKGNPSGWTTARGVLEGEDGQHRIHPSTLGNNLLGANLRDVLKAARKTLATMAGVGSFDRVLAARLMPAVDPATFVGEIDESEMGPDLPEVTEPTDAAGRFAARANEVGPLVDQLVLAAIPTAGAITKAWAQIQGLADAGEHERALAMLDRLGPILESGRETLEAAEPQLELAPAPSGEALFLARMAELGPIVQRRLLALGDVPLAVALRSRLGLALAARKSENYLQAGDHLDAIEELLVDDPAPPVDEAPPTEVKAPRSKTASRVTFIQARLTYLDARSTMGAHLDRLIEAMEAAAADEDPDGPFGPEAIDSMANHLRSALGGLDERLVWALDDAMMAPSPELRARHEAKAAALVGEYLRFLEGEPLFDDLDEETGFGRFPIVETARKSLEQIATLL